MSVVMEMHQDWKARNERLWGRPAKAIVIPPPPLPPEAMPEVTYGAPVDLCNAPDWRIIVQLAALKHGVTVDAIMGRSRQVDIVLARREAVRICHTHLHKVSLSMLGRLFGRDHTTIINLLRPKKVGKVRGAAASVVDPAHLEQFIEDRCSILRGGQWVI